LTPSSPSTESRFPLFRSGWLACSAHLGIQSTYKVTPVPHLTKNKGMEGCRAILLETHSIVSQIVAVLVGLAISSWVAGRRWLTARLTGPCSYNFKPLPPHGTYPVAAFGET
jgi:hypothetical protein